MIPRHDMQSFLLPIVGDEPSRTFRKQPDQAQLQHTRGDLQQTGESPRPVALDLQGAEGRPGCDGGTEVVEGVVDRGDLASLAGMGEFGDEKRTCDTVDAGT